MAPFDIAVWRSDVSETEPAGPNLEFDPDFGALERAAQGKPEQQFGDTVIPAEDPDWGEVEAQAEALLERTRDLRVLAYLAVAKLHARGLHEYAKALGLAAEWLRDRWEHLHPQLDPEDDNDPTPRANAVREMAHPGRVLRALRDLPLAVSPRGRVTWREIAFAIGAIEPPPGVPRPSESELRGAFADADPARVAMMREAAAEAGAAAEAIRHAFDGHPCDPKLDDLVKLLREMARDIGRFAPSPGAEPAARSADGETAPFGAAPNARGAGAASLGPVTSRDDALRLLDLACDYYRRYEPSSPLPLLIARARRLADKDFLEVLRDIAPDGLGQAQIVMGQSDNEGG